jgi:hypothetical protein
MVSGRFIVLNVLLLRELPAAICNLLSAHRWVVWCCCPGEAISLPLSTQEKPSHEVDGANRHAYAKMIPESIFLDCPSP